MAEQTYTPEQLLGNAINRIQCYAEDHNLPGSAVAALFEAGLAAQACLGRRTAPPHHQPQAAEPRSDFTPLLEQRAAAWLSVRDELARIDPAWYSRPELTGEQKAVAFIDQLGTALAAKPAVDLSQFREAVQFWLFCLTVMTGDPLLQQEGRAELFASKAEKARKLLELIGAQGRQT